MKNRGTHYCALNQIFLGRFDVKLMSLYLSIFSRTLKLYKVMVFAQVIFFNSNCSEKKNGS